MKNNQEPTRECPKCNREMMKAINWYVCRHCWHKVSCHSIKPLVEEECCGLCGSRKICKENPPCLHHQDIFDTPQKKKECEHQNTHKEVTTLYNLVCNDCLEVVLLKVK